MRAAIAVLALMLANCTADAGTEPVCTRSDTGSPCSQGTTAEPLEGGGWSVSLRVTQTEQVEYTDQGRVCAFTHTSCFQAECNIHGDLSKSEAIAYCRNQYGF